MGTNQAAAILGVSTRTVVRLVDAGDLVPRFKAPIGRHGSYMFDRSDVESLQAARRTQAKETA